MKRYIGLLSEIKDLNEKNQLDVDAYIKIAQEYQGKILEIGSKSGNISVGLAKEGRDITCLEIHREMIYLHEEKLTEDISDNTTIMLSDLCSFDLGEKYDLIIAANNAIHAVKTEEEMICMFESVKKHLSNVGVFVIECEAPNYRLMQEDHDIEHTKKYKNPRTGMDIEEFVTHFYDLQKRIRWDKVLISEFAEGKIKRRIQVMQEYKLWNLEELRNMLHQVGLNIMLESGDLKQVEDITEKSSYMILFSKA